MLKAETFIQFITRSTGLGRTPWLRTIIIHALCILGIILGLSTVKFDYAWIASIVCGGILAGLWISTWINWRDEQKIVKRMETTSNVLHHHPDLWDASPYYCKHMILPDSKTLECAHPRYHDKNIPSPTDKERKEKIYKPK